MWSQRRERATPSAIIRQVPGGGAVKPTQPFLQSFVVRIDVIAVEIGCVGGRLAWPWQDMCRDPGATGESDDPTAAIATERTGWRHHPLQRRGDRGRVQDWQHRIRGRALAVTRAIVRPSRPCPASVFAGLHPELAALPTAGRVRSVR